MNHCSEMLEFCGSKSFVLTYILLLSTSRCLNYDLLRAIIGHCPIMALGLVYYFNWYQPAKQALRKVLCTDTKNS